MTRNVEVVTLKCENCASDFAPKVKRGSNAQKYCSEKCRDTAYMRRKRARPEYAARVRERWANDPKFRESRLATARRWRERHPEKAKAATVKWVSRNLEHMAKYQRRRRSKNPEKYRQQQRDYYRRTRAVASRGVLAAKPKRPRGRPEGKWDKDTNTRLSVIAYCQVAGMSNYKIATYWKLVTGKSAAKTTIDSCIAEHAIEIEHKKSLLSGMSEPERDTDSGLSESQRKVVREMAAARRKR